MGSTGRLWRCSGPYPPGDELHQRHRAAARRRATPPVGQPHEALGLDIWTVEREVHGLAGLHCFWPPLSTHSRTRYCPQSQTQANMCQGVSCTVGQTIKGPGHKCTSRHSRHAKALPRSAACKRCICHRLQRIRYCCRSPVQSDRFHRSDCSGYWPQHLLVMRFILIATFLYGLGP